MVVFMQVCSVQFDRKDIPMNKMVATTLEAKFHIFDLRTHHPQSGFTSLTEKVLAHKVKYYTYALCHGNFYDSVNFDPVLLLLKN